MCISLESSTPLSFSPSLLLSNCSLSHHFILLFFSPFLCFSLSISLILIFYQSANANITATHWICKHAWAQKHICRQTHDHAYAYINAQTHPHRHGKDTHTLTVAVLSCTATHCVYAEPLSLLVERCYALLTSGEENIQSCPLVIHWCHNYPPLHLPLSSSEFVYRVGNK